MKLHIDPSSCFALHFWHADFENAISVCGFNALGFDANGKRDGALESAGKTLLTMELVILDFRDCDGSNPRS